MNFRRRLALRRDLMTVRVSMLLKSRASLTCFRACFLPGQAKDLSAVSVLSRLQEPATGRCPNQMNPVNVLTSIFCKVCINVYFNIVRHCVLRLKLDLHLRVPFTFVHVSHLIRYQYTQLTVLKKLLFLQWPHSCCVIFSEYVFKSN